MTDLDLPALRNIAEAALAETIPPGPAASEKYRAAFDPPTALTLIDAAEEVPRLTERLREAKRLMPLLVAGYKPVPDGDGYRPASISIDVLRDATAFLANANSPSPDVVGAITAAMRRERDKWSHEDYDWQVINDLIAVIERRDWRKEPT